MASNYITTTTLGYFYNRIKNIFALKSTVDALEDTVDDIISVGGEPNKIDTVKVNGTALVPDGNKAVNVEVPTKVSDLTNDGDGTAGSAFATEDYVDTNGGKIDKIKVNGTEQTITNKAVDITVPTNNNQLTNGAGYQTAADVASAIQGKADSATNLAGYGITDAYTKTEVDNAIDMAVSSVYKYKGSVANYAALPASGVETGWVYDTQDTGMNYAWNGTGWDNLGQLIDTSTLWAKADLVAATTAQIDALFD